MIASMAPPATAAGLNACMHPRTYPPSPPRAQVVGALAGAALQVLITPGLHFGTPFMPSCHVPITGMGGTPLYIWETLAAFVFV